MNSLMRREAGLAARRRELLLRSRGQRATITRTVTSLQPQLDTADKAMQLGQTLRRHAGWIALAAGAVIAIKRPRGALKLALRAWTMWRTVQALR